MMAWGSRDTETQPIMAGKGSKVTGTTGSVVAGDRKQGTQTGIGAWL